MSKQSQQKIHVPEQNGIELTTKQQIIGLAAAALVGLTAFTLTRYRTSLSNQWLVRTGMGVNDIQIGKRFFQWPFQNIQYIDLSPESFKFTISAMSKETPTATAPYKGYIFWLVSTSNGSILFQLDTHTSTSQSV